MRTLKSELNHPRDPEWLDAILNSELESILNSRIVNKWTRFNSILEPWKTFVRAERPSDVVRRADKTGMENSGPQVSY